MKNFSCFLAAALLFMTACSSGDDDKTIPADTYEVSLNKATHSMEVGESETLIASGVEGTFSWESSDNSIATVIEGAVTAESPGEATITASINGKSAICVVTVKSLVAHSGTAGDLEWKLREDGLLDISGNGAMPDYEANVSPAPWADHASDIERIAVEDGVTTIGVSAFESCPALESVTLPEGITFIGDSAFSFCEALEEINLPSTLTTLEGHVFNFNTALTAIVIPGKVTTVADGTFAGCSSLTDVTISEGVTEIEQNAFFGCSALESITLPSTLTSIGETAFLGNPLLTDVTCLAATPPSLGFANFGGNGSGNTIYVPANSVSAYEADSDWSGAFSYIEAISAS